MSACESMKALDVAGVLEDATRAPSSHNSQPWRFLCTDDGFVLYADFSRQLPVVDPQNREMFISCGAALEHLVLSIRHRGFEAHAVIRDDDGDKVATVVVGQQRMPSSSEVELYEAIATRQTVRKAHDMMPLPNDLRELMQHAASDRDTQLNYIDDIGSRNDLAQLVMEADSVQSADPEFRKELAHWMRSNNTKQRDGMTGDMFGCNDAEAWLAPLVIRTFDTGDRRGASDRDLVTASSGIAVLSTPTDSKYCWVSCGQALARMSLCAAHSGFMLSFLNQAVEVPAVRNRLQMLLRMSVNHTGYPQIIVRVGRAVSEPHSRRRQIDEVLIKH